MRLKTVAMVTGTTEQIKTYFIFYRTTLYKFSVKIIDFQCKMTKILQILAWKVDKKIKKVHIRIGGDGENIGIKNDHQFT